MTAELVPPPAALVSAPTRLDAAVKADQQVIYPWGLVLTAAASGVAATAAAVIGLIVLSH